MSLSVLSIGVWMITIILLMVPSEETLAEDHSQRSNPSIEMKSSDRLAQVASRFESSRSNQVIEKDKGTWQEVGLTRSWANEWSQDGTFSIDDLLTKLEIKKEPFPF